MVTVLVMVDVEVVVVSSSPMTMATAAARMVKMLLNCILMVFRIRCTVDASVGVTDARDRSEAGAAVFFFVGWVKSEGGEINNGTGAFLVCRIENETEEKKNRKMARLIS